MSVSNLQKLSDRLSSQASGSGPNSSLELLRLRVAQRKVETPSSPWLAPVVPASAPLSWGPIVSALGIRQLRPTVSVGQVITLSVRFSEPVSVTGRPSLGLLLQGGSAFAAYLAGSGTNELTFLHVVRPGDQAPVLQVLSQAPIQLQGGQIQSLLTGLKAQLPQAGDPLNGALNALPGLRVDGGVDPALQVLQSCNRLLLDGIGKAGLSPALASRALALFNAASFDCINACRGSTYSGYAFSSSPTTWNSSDVSAALSQVAGILLGDVFSGTVQAQTVANALSAALLVTSHNSAGERGLALGRLIGEQYRAMRQDDLSHLGTAGYIAPLPVAAITTPAGTYVATAPGFPKAASLPDWGQVTPWITGSLQVSQPGTTAPGATSPIPTAPSLDSETYARDFQEVKLIGARNSTTRTADESEIALFWANGPATETPPGHWQEIVSTIAAQKALSLLDTSRLYAGVGLALADAGIAAWSVKYSPALWRPITAIQQADRDGNPSTSADADWASFVSTPMFPTFPSGHSTFSAAAATVASALLGPVQPFSVLGGDGRTIQREYSSLWQAAEESGRSRILGGIHFNFDNLTGLAMGQAIGSFVVDQALMAQVWLGDGGITYRHDPLNFLDQARAVQGGMGDDLIMGASLQGNRLFGGSGRDHLQGGSRADGLDGGEGMDQLQGFGGSDSLRAGAGGARLEGSSGAEAGEVDHLICGSGVDTVVLSNSNVHGVNYSFVDSYAVVQGFDPLVDRFELGRNDFSANIFRFESLLPAATSNAANGLASTWLYRNDDIIACFEGVDMARWGVGASSGPLSPFTCPSMAVLV